LDRWLSWNGSKSGNQSYQEIIVSYSNIISCLIKQDDYSLIIDWSGVLLHLTGLVFFYILIAISMTSLICSAILPPVQLFAICVLGFISMHVLIVFCYVSANEMMISLNIFQKLFRTDII